mmetsp:Transcript_10233/g.9891  ORF Transcript_10233/g.9891 Transcript_10233/m.9891 type:complete len:115 (+) Transcript_10233:202-546(+)
MFEVVLFLCVIVARGVGREGAGAILYRKSIITHTSPQVNVGDVIAWRYVGGSISVVKKTIHFVTELMKRSSRADPYPSPSFGTPSSSNNINNNNNNNNRMTTTKTTSTDNRRWQ